MDDSLRSKLGLTRLKVFISSDIVASIHVASCPDGRSWEDNRSTRIRPRVCIAKTVQNLG